MKTSQLLGLGLLAVAGYFLLKQAGVISGVPTSGGTEQRAAAMLDMSRSRLAQAQQGKDKGASRAAKIASGASTGASIGMVGGPWGLAIGAGAGAVAGIFV